MPKEAPIVIIKDNHGAKIVKAFNKNAFNLGIRMGFNLTQCRVINEDIQVFDDNPDEDYKALLRLAHWSMRYSPSCSLIANDPYYCLIIDITGADHLYCGEQEILNDIINRFGKLNIEVKAACADNLSCAWAFAFYDKRAKQGLILEGDIKDYIDRLPIAALRIEKSTQEQLLSLGLHSIGQLRALPTKSFARRFGIYLIRAINRIYGLEQEALNPVKELVPDIIIHRLNYAILNQEGLELEINNAIEKFCEFLANSNRGAKKIRLCFFRVDGFTFELNAVSATTNHDPKVWKQLIKYKLETIGDKIDFGFGIDQINAYLELCEVLKFQATSLDKKQADAIIAQDNLNRLIERLSSKIGPENVSRIKICDNYVPERALIKLNAIENNIAGQKNRPENLIHDNRPLFLFKHPQEIVVMAEVPDGAPLRFIFRKQSFKVKSASSPERIIEPLCNNSSKYLSINSHHLRDYYKIETEDGARFFIFRRGLYGAETTPKWFIHGAG